MYRVSSLIALSLTLFCANAMAGQHVNSPVSILSSGSVRSVAGGVSSAYNSADTVQLIGCSVGANAGGSLTAVCEATTATGVYAQCITSDPALVQAAAAINSGSVIYFHLPTTGTAPLPCIDLTVVNYSTSAPKK